MKKGNSRSARKAQDIDCDQLIERWNNAAYEAWLAVDELVHVQCKFEDLRNSAPRHLKDVFDRICNLDVVSVDLMLVDADVTEIGTDPPATTEAVSVAP